MTGTHNKRRNSDNQGIADRLRIAGDLATELANAFYALPRGSRSRTTLVDMVRTMLYEDTRIGRLEDKLCIRSIRSVLAEASRVLAGLEE